MPRASDYTISDTDDHRICIAPRVRKGRCTRIVGRANEAKVETYKEEIIDAHDAGTRLILARQIVLHSCCLKDHRASLTDNSDLLDKIARRWLEFHHAKESKEGEAERDEKQPPDAYLVKDAAIETSLCATAEISTVIEGTTRSSRRLRGFDPLPQEPQGDIVVPYGVSRVETLEDAMRKDAKKSPRKGYLYCLSGVPDHVKIGYSATSVEARLADWRKCQPDAKLLYECEIDWPRKVERFVHLELHQHRRKLAKECDGHQTVHRELFETSVEVVKRVLEAWSSLLAVQRLYSENGLLLPVWITWLRKIEGKVSVEALLKVCRQEQLAASRHKREDELKIKTDVSRASRFVPYKSIATPDDQESEREAVVDPPESLEEMRAQLRKWTSMVSRLQKSISLAEESSCTTKQTLRPAKNVLHFMM